MIRKPVRWRRLGAATLATFAVALTALAAQVSPPNAETPAPKAAAPAKQERQEIKLAAAVLDRYVGTYKLDDMQIFTVTRKGDGLQAQLTGQGPADIFAESETGFFYKIVDAQLEFASNGGPATSVTLHQGGSVVEMPRIDASTAAFMKAELDTRIASNSPAPGSEAAVRKMAGSFSAGTPNYEDMEPDLEKATRAQAEHLIPSLKTLGAVKSVEFRKVGEGGWDVYRVTYEHGALMWRIGLAPNGKVNYALVLPDA